MSLLDNPRIRIGIGLAVVAVLGVFVWLRLTAGRESTDDAQVDAHVTQIAARVGGTVLQVHVDDNRAIEAGAALVEIDPRDYQVAVDKARAALADAEAAAQAAQSGVPITTLAAGSTLTSAHGGVAQAESSVAAARKQVEAAHARVASAQARQREQEANAAKAARDVERIRGLLAKDEISQQQFDAATAAADAGRAAADSAKAQVTEAEAGVLVAESQLAEAQAGHRQADAALQSARTAPEQVKQMKARAEAAQAQVTQAKAALDQAELNLQYTRLTAPVSGIVSRKSVEVGQVVQPGQPLLAIIPLDDVWIIANFKETQLTDMRAGQKATVKVDAYGGRTFTGRVDSIAAATGARFSLLPPENATGNFVKVVQRVPVKIVIDAGQNSEHQLRPGMSVVPTIYTK
ncbi:MAG TPA: HlyD family secretion protein [Vicinamibacterales bacterium]|nr:HlyD family secretion protein [Vicinamibacterales bacterium]